MPIVCPDPQVLTAWRNAMIGVGIVPPIMAIVALVWVTRARFATKLPLIFTSICALANGAISAIAWIFALRLNDAFAKVAQWFPNYPQGCTPGNQHWNDLYIPAIERVARQAVEPLENAAQIVLIVALAIAIALGLCILCILIWGKKRGIALPTSLV